MFLSTPKEKKRKKISLLKWPMCVACSFFFFAFYLLIFIHFWCRTSSFLDSINLRSNWLSIAWYMMYHVVIASRAWMSNFSFYCCCRFWTLYSLLILTNTHYIHGISRCIRLLKFQYHQMFLIVRLACLHRSTFFSIFPFFCQVWLTETDVTQTECYLWNVERNFEMKFKNERSLHSAFGWLVARSRNEEPTNSVRLLLLQV